jgi:GTP-binding protein EngB required for normal cell division
MSSAPTPAASLDVRIPVVVQPQHADSRLKSLARVSGGALFGVASAAGNALVSYVSTARGPLEGSPLAALSSAEVLRVANTLSALLQQSPADDFKMPELPQMVVVGTQSSGKSSLLNAIMACDLLPLGESMVTRCPLHLQLVHTPTESTAAMRAEFGTYASGAWQTQRTISLAAPTPAPSEILAVRAEIEQQTNALAGPGKGIAAQPIHLRIHSAYVPDLSLVDLPGLTQMALTDQGQPRDIKQQIHALVEAHIAKSRVVILAVLPARTDLEADAALELVKRVDPRGERTIGVLTKVDLMSQVLRPPVPPAHSRASPPPPGASCCAHTLRPPAHLSLTSPHLALT